MNEGFNRDLDFSDVSPWDETLKDDSSDQPSFSTPAKTVAVEVSAPTRFMSKIFQKQIGQSRAEESRLEKTCQKQEDEIVQLKKELENQLMESKVRTYLKKGNLAETSGQKLKTFR